MAYVKSVAQGRERCTKNPHANGLRRGREDAGAANLGEFGVKRNFRSRRYQNENPSDRPETHRSREVSRSNGGDCSTVVREGLKL